MIHSHQLEEFRHRIYISTAEGCAHRVSDEPELSEVLDYLTENPQQEDKQNSHYIQINTHFVGDNIDPQRIASSPATSTPRTGSPPSSPRATPVGAESGNLNKDKQERKQTNRLQNSAVYAFYMHEQREKEAAKAAKEAEEEDTMEQRACSSFSVGIEEGIGNMQGHKDIAEAARAPNGAEVIQ